MATVAATNYLSTSTLEKIKRLDIRAQLVVEGYVTGEHQSPYNGFAVEFASHREYVPGDETRHIDWKVWSKTDRLYIKQYEEETNLNCTLVMDCSHSMQYGAVRRKGAENEPRWRKFDYAATAAASLAFLLQQQQDAVGLVQFNTRVLQSLPPSSNPNHLKRLVHELEKTTPDDQTDVGDVFLELASHIRSRSMVVLLSDLLVDLDQLTEAIRQLRVRRHDVIVLHVMHEDELKFPFDDNTLFRGLEREVQLHTDPRALREAYLKVLDNYLARVKKLCADAGVDYALLSTAQPLDAALSRFLNFRLRTRRLLP